MNKGLCLVLALLLTTAAFTVCAETAESSISWMEFINLAEEPYAAVQSRYTQPKYDGSAVRQKLNLSLGVEGVETLTFSVPQDGLYEIWFTYRNESTTILPTEVAIMVDGDYPFDEMRSIQFRSEWVDDGVFPQDRYGNELATYTYAADKVLETGLCDSAARTLDPFLFELTAGTHTLTLHVMDGAMQLLELSLRAPEVLAEYAPGDPSGDEIIVIEAEQIHSRNSSSIRGGSEYITTLSPYSTGAKVINHLAGGSFHAAGDMVSWEFEVAETGWYQFGAYYRQSGREDFPVYADILIDGKIPSFAAQAVAFDYCDDFEYMVGQYQGEALALYLTEGTHTLSLRLNSTILTPVFELIETLNAQINALFQEITRLSGGVTTDEFRYYNVQGSIPDVVEILEGWADQCDETLSYLKELSPNGKTTAFAYLQLSADQLRRLAEAPEDLPRRVSELSTGSNSVAKLLAQMMLDLTYNSLSIDQIYLYQTEAELPDKPNMLQSAYLTASRFLNSFTTKGYSSRDKSSDHLQVWMGEGRMYVEQLQNLIDTQFTPMTGIEVDLSMMSAENKLVLANAAEISPDVALSINFTLPSKLDIRGALYDLTTFEDFPEVAQWFSSGLFVPYIYDEGVYALPQQLNFWTMYYRKDILEYLELEVPDTMNDVCKKLLPVLQANGMNFFYPTAGMSGMRTFGGTLPLIMQSGGSLYGETVAETTLDSAESLAGFRTLTELFTIYSMPVDSGAGFYQRFRDGTLPIGISNLGLYNQLNRAAPELDGLWGITLIPGVVQPDGSVSRWTTGNMQTCCILQSTDMPEEAWAFLKWWMSAEVQSTYANILFTTYGEDTLWTSANTAAFTELPIKYEHKKVILEQMEWMSDAPWGISTYMLERELSNAFLAVVVEGEDARRALDQAVKRIDRETYRKLEEFGYYKDGVMVKEYLTPDASFIEELIAEYLSSQDEEE